MISSDCGDLYRRTQWYLKGTQELVDAFAGAFNKFWWVEDDVYDYEEGTEEYENVEAQLSGILEEVLL